MGRFPRQETTEQRRPFAKRATTGNELPDEVAAASSIDAASRASDPSGNRAARTILSDVGRELRIARLGAGLTQTQVGRASGLSGSYVSLIERARADGVSLVRLARIASVVGLDLSVRAYPGGSILRDAGHRALLERLRMAISPTLGWRTEVPLPNAGDQRAWDAMIIGKASAADSVVRVGVEAETRPRDAQALQRRIALKCRDGGVDHVLLVIAATRGNRAFLRVAAPALAPDFPIHGRVAIASLRAGHNPGGSSLMLL